MSDRDKAVREVAKRGVDNAEAKCHGKSADTIRATLRWYDGSRNRSPNLLAWKLQQGGVYVPEEEAPTEHVVWNEQNRMAWIERHMPDEIEKDYGFRAEVALIGVVRAGHQVSPARVRQFMADVGEPSEPKQSSAPVEQTTLTPELKRWKEKAA